MFNFMGQQLASFYSAARDVGVHDTSALKANNQGATQDFYSFGTPDNGVQPSSEPPSNNKGLPRKDIDKTIGSMPGSAGIRNSSTPVDSYGSSEHEHEQIPAELPDDEVPPPELERGAPAAEDETDFPQPRVRRRQSAAFSSFFYKLADTNDPSATADQSSIHSSTSVLGAATEETLSPRTASNTFPTGADTPSKESSRCLQSIPEKETSATSVRFSFVLDESIAKKMSEAGRLRRTQSQNLNSVANSRAQKPTSEPPNSTQELPCGEVTQSLPLPPSTDPHGDCRRDLKTLRDLYDRQRAELKESQETIQRLKAENLREKAHLSKSVQEANILRQEHKTSGQRISTLKEHLSMVTTELNNLKKEKQGWQGQLDAMQHRVQQAEHRVRCLDNLTRLKLEAREDGAFGSVKRTKNFQTSNQKANAKVIDLVVSLNEGILQYATLAESIGQKVNFPVSSPHARSRSREILGSKLTTILKKYCSLSSDFRRILMQVLFELFMVYWCTQIIEGWYPKQKCFADVLLEFSQSTNSSTIVPGARVDHGKIKILQTDVSTDSDYSTWVSDIHQDLSEILSVGGVRLTSDRFRSKLLTLVKRAHQVRTALAEKDLCGGLEILIVGHGMPFQHKWMDDEYPFNDGVSAPSMTMDLVAGTCGIGLRRIAVGKTSAISTPVNANQLADVVLKPKVVLEKILDEDA
ncbi:hypothetical protein D9613_002544 [Agrocybe pediades]|uniref:Uncharacterized protein n=1 Tax=Agrocybe pediades TaxID=84607 RepID=A0A8H4QPX5_9AGAR|nr:hypothetical protein D9613_002544 [Agrocybe pediades]